MGVWVGKLNLKRRSIDFHAPTELQRLLSLLAGLFPSRAQHKSFPAKPSPGQRKHPAANPNRSEHLCMLLCFWCRCCREFGARVHHYAPLCMAFESNLYVFCRRWERCFLFFFPFFLLQPYVTFGHSSNKVYKGRCTFVFFFHLQERLEMDYFGWKRKCTAWMHRFNYPTALYSFDLLSMSVLFPLSLCFRTSLSNTNTIAGHQLIPLNLTGTWT